MNIQLPFIKTKLYINIKILTYTFNHAIAERGYLKECYLKHINLPPHRGSRPINSSLWRGVSIANYSALLGKQLLVFLTSMWWNHWHHLTIQVIAIVCRYSCRKKQLILKLYCTSSLITHNLSACAKLFFGSKTSNFPSSG